MTKPKIAKHQGVAPDPRSTGNIRLEKQAAAAPAAEKTAAAAPAPEAAKSKRSKA